MKSLLALLLICLGATFAAADTSHAALVLAKKTNHHPVHRHHAHKATKHHAPKHRHHVAA